MYKGEGENKVKCFTFTSPSPLYAGHESYTCLLSYTRLTHVLVEQLLCRLMGAGLTSIKCRGVVLLYSIHASQTVELQHNNVLRYLSVVVCHAETDHLITCSAFSYTDWSGAGTNRKASSVGVACKQL